MRNLFRTAVPDLALIALILVVIAILGFYSWWVGGLLVFALIFILRRTYVAYCQDQRAKNKREWQDRQLRDRQCTN